MEEAKKTNYIAQSLTGILDIIICLLLFISSIYKGAFYKSDFLFPNVIISIIGVAYLGYKIIKEISSKEKDSKLRSKVRVLIDMLMLILPFTYLFPILFKTYVSLPDSVFEMLRYVNMTVLYFIARNTKAENLYMNVFVLISMVQSVLGIDQLTFRCFEEFLNNLSTGYLPDMERLSATLQYANITGIVILFGTINCFSNLSNILEKKNKFKYLELVVCIFLCLLQITAIILTKSRVATVVTVLMLFADSIFSMKYINKKVGIYKLILTIYGVFGSSVIENVILDNNFSMIYVILLVFSLVFVVIHILFKIIKVGINNLSKLFKIKKVLKIFHNKSVKYISLCGFVLITIIVLFTPKDLKISNNTKGTIQIERSIYNFKEGKNTLEIELDTLKEDTRYTIEIYGLKENYTQEQLAVFNYYDKTKDEFETKLELGKDIRKLNILVKVQRGSLKVEQFKINNRDVIMSYLFIPDNIMFKLKDTFAGVYGDSLRLEYVKDCFKLVKQSPLVGVGGEGFKHTYGTVQEFGYISSEAHSAIMQSLVEVGIIGACTLVGIISLSFVIIIKLIIRFKKIDREDKKYIFTLIMIYLSLLSIVIFDLAFSYAFMIYVFGIVLALIVKAYIDILYKYKEREGQKSRLDWSYIKIVVLSLSIVCLGATSYFSINAFRASLIRVPNKNEELNVIEIAENIARLELKTKQDRFDMDYIRELNEEYMKYKALVLQGYVNTSNDNETRNELIKELNSITGKIKDNADKMLEYEYYDKYVLNDVADVYIENYMTFVEIYEKQFDNSEVAYAFYLNYVIKLTDRIKELNPHSMRANDIYINMCNKYIEELESDNKYLQSNAVTNAINQFRNRI